MAYAGNQTLDLSIQQRILMAFAEAARMYRDGLNEEALTILRSIADVDPEFLPAQRLDQAINAGAPVDLAKLLGEVTGGGVDEGSEKTLVQAREAMALRDFPAALTLAQSVLKDLPGQAEARAIVNEAQAKMRAGGDIQTLLGRARMALEAGAGQEAQGFVKLAKNLDPAEPEVLELERKLTEKLGQQLPESQGEFEFEVFQFGSGQTPLSPTPQVATVAPAQSQSRQTESRAPQSAASFGTPTAPTVARPIPTAPSPPVARPTVAPPSVQPAKPQTPSFGAQPSQSGGVSFGSTSTDLEMNFEPSSFVASEGGMDDRVQALLDQGQAAFESNDFQSAIDTWSRIYLIDTHNDEAERRIEQARRRREEIERLAEHRFFEARDAFEHGNLDDARRLCSEVMELVPQHLEAHDLLSRLETPEAPPPSPAPAPIELEDDLFRDDFVPSNLAAMPSSGAALGDMALPPPMDLTSPSVRGAKRPAATGIRALPTLWIIVGGLALILLLAAGFLLKGKIFSGTATLVEETMAAADKAAKEGRLGDAIAMLQSLQGQVEGEDWTRINRQMLEFKAKQKPKTPVIVQIDSTPIKNAIAAEQMLKAQQLLTTALEKNPSDAELTKLQDDLRAFSPALLDIANALRVKRWEAVCDQTSDLLQKHPGNKEAISIWQVAAFNDAVSLLRRYEITRAHNLLVELAKQKGDPEVVRLEQLSKSYLTRPRDPRFDIFVSNIELRSLE